MHFQREKKQRKTLHTDTHKDGDEKFVFCHFQWEKFSFSDNNLVIKVEDVICSIEIWA